MLGPVLYEPAVHTGAVDAAAAGRLGDGMPLGHQQQRLEAAIHPGLAGASKRGGQPLAIRLVEPRLGRVIMVLHAPSGNTRSSRVASLMATYLDLHHDPPVDPVVAHPGEDAR